MNKKPQTQPRVKVLYQNLNGTWYAFAENGGELYFGKVPVKHGKKSAKKDRSRTAEPKSLDKAA